jgi:RNA polymerase sigma factor (sigma-70 family)
MISDHDEAVLIAKLKANDSSARGQLLHIYAPKLTAFAMKFGLSRGDSAEVVSQSLQRVIEEIDAYKADKGAKFSTWVCQITKNRVIDRLRQIQREQEKSGGQLESVEKLEEEGHQIGSAVVHLPSDDEEVESRIEHELLHQALENLDSVDRVVLLEWAYGASFKEIGQLIGKKEGTAKVRKHRALAKLRGEYLRVLAIQNEEIQEALKARYEAGIAKHEMDLTAETQRTQRNAEGKREEI